MSTPEAGASTSDAAFANDQAHQMPSDARALSPGFRDLLDERRELCDQLGEVRERLAALVGRYERDGAIPLFEVERLLSERLPS